MNPDAELLQRYTRTHDAMAFAALVQRHMPMVYRAAWRQLAGDTHGAEDVAQAVFTLLARKAGSLGNHGNLAGWLHVTTRNIVRDHLRAQRRRATQEREVARMNEQSLAGGADVATDWYRLQPLLDEALGGLRPDDREALLLRYFQGLSLASVGAALAVGEDAARMRVNRALERLRDQLAHRGIKSTAAALGVVLTAEPALAAPSAGLATTVSAVALAEAAAAGGVASLTGFWLLMNSVKLATAGAAALAAVGWATWEYGQQEEILQEAIRAETAATKVTVARKTPPAPPAEPAGKSATGLAPTVASPAPRKTAKEREVEAVARGDALLAAHPELRAALEESRRARAAADIAPICVALRLTPAQRQAFEEIAVQTSSAGTTILGINGTGDMTFRLPRALNDEEVKLRLEALLGEEGMKALKVWQESSRGASQVREVAGWAAESGQPMTTQQAQALRNVFMTTKPPSRDRDATAYWDEIIARATTLLPPEQVEALALQKARAELRQADAAAAKAELAAEQGSG